MSSVCLLFPALSKGFLKAFNFSFLYFFLIPLISFEAPQKKRENKILTYFLSSSDAGTVRF